MNPPFKISSNIINLVSQISEIVAILEHNELQNIPIKLRKENYIKTITGTLEIEGSTLGIEKITAIIEGKRVLGSIKEIEEVKGALRIYENIDKFDYTKIDNLLKAHKMLMGEILTKAGSWRTQNVGVGNSYEVSHIAPPFTQVPNFMYNLFEWLKKSDIHPLIKSSVFHYEFEFIHPFINGNGRIGRFWQTLILYNWKNIFAFLPTESIIRDSGKKYYKVIEESSLSSNNTPFIEFMLEAILKTCKNSLKDIKNVPKNDLLNVPKNRVENILQLIKQNSKITIDEIANKLNVSSKTIKRDIAKLKEQNKLQRVGKKGGYWVVL